MRLSLALLIWSSLAQAQSRPEALAPLRVDQGTLENAYKKARAKRNIGIALAVPGVASTVLGIIIITYGATQEPYINAQIGEIVGGSIVSAVGMAVGIPGVVLWSQGQDEMDVVKWRRQQMKVMLHPSPTGFAITF
jgi:hypothetical protein